MTGSLIFNDASLSFTSPNECGNKLENFFKIIHTANSAGINFYSTDGVYEKWSSINYCEGFSFGEWINLLDHDTSLVVKNVILKVKCPVLHMEDEIAEAIKNSFYFLANDRDIEVESLGLTSQIDGKAISISSQKHWASNQISIIKQWDDFGQWKEDQLGVTNIYCKDTLNSYLKEVESQRQSDFHYLRSLSNKDNNDFPNIIFCQSVLKNFKSNSVTTLDFPKIIYALRRLNDAILVSENLDSLRFNSRLTITGESNETMARAKYSRQREFIHPDLGKAIFEQHVKNFPDGKRMHILVDFQNRTVSIGYFGEHLPTVDNPQ